MQENTKNKRKSGVELLKIIGIFLIVISHVIQTLGSDKLAIVGFNDYFLNVGLPSSNPQHFILGMLSYSGALGNAIFATCSFWYLQDKKQTNVQKMFRMLLEIWVISITWLLVTVIFTDINLTSDYIIKSIFPLN